jgi:hypothetical protein
MKAKVLMKDESGYNKPDPGPKDPVYCWIWTDNNSGTLNERIDTFLKDGNKKPGFKIIQALQSQSSVYISDNPDVWEILTNYMITIFYTFY